MLTTEQNETIREATETEIFQFDFESEALEIDARLQALNQAMKTSGMRGSQDYGELANAVLFLTNSVRKLLEAYTQIEMDQAKLRELTATEKV